MSIGAEAVAILLRNSIQLHISVFGNPLATDLPSESSTILTEEHWPQLALWQPASWGICGDDLLLSVRDVFKNTRL